MKCLDVIKENFDVDYCIFPVNLQCCQGLVLKQNIASWRVSKGLLSFIPLPPCVKWMGSLWASHSGLVRVGISLQHAKSLWFSFIQSKHRAKTQKDFRKLYRQHGARDKHQMSRKVCCFCHVWVDSRFVRYHFLVIFYYSYFFGGQGQLFQLTYCAFFRSNEGLKLSYFFSAGDVILLGKTNMLRFNHPQEAAKLRKKRYVS